MVSTDRLGRKNAIEVALGHSVDISDFLQYELLEINPLSYSYPVLLRRWISFGCLVRIDLV